MEKQRLLLTEREIEFRLEIGLKGKLIQYEDIFRNKHIGILQRLAVNTIPGELMVVFQINDRGLQKHECDIAYFLDSTEILYGDTYTGERRDVRRILKEG